MAHAVYGMATPMALNRLRRTGLEETMAREEYWACIVIPVTFWLFASLTLTLGLYGTETIVLGPYYSRLYKANSWLVDQIEVTESGKFGPMLYGFRSRPNLGPTIAWNDSRHFAIDPNSHQEFEVWLNEGSKLNVTCSIKTSRYFSILVAILEGTNGLREWTSDPTNRFTTMAWVEISGQGGSLEYEVPGDGHYYVAVGNLNPQSIEIVLEWEVAAKMFNIDSATYRCSLGEKTCKVELTVFGDRYALLTTPNVTLNGSNFWEVTLSYGVRWVTYFVALVLLILVVWAALKILSSVGGAPAAEVDARAPLLTTKENSALVGTSVYGSIGSDANGTDGGELDCSSSDNFDDKVCVVCLDSRKSCFFVPCGHCATCIPCAARIHQGEARTCPICRSDIEDVKKMFHV